MGYFINQKRSVANYSLDDTLIKTFKSIGEASGYYKITACCISNAIKGNQKTAGGYKWKYFNKTKHE